MTHLAVTPPVSAVYPARFWLATCIVAIVAALAGLWAADQLWVFDDIRNLLTKPDFRAENRTLLLHIILGINIIVLPAILALLTRFARALKIITTVIAALLVVAVGCQIWLGVILLYGM